MNKTTSIIIIILVFVLIGFMGNQLQEAREQNPNSTLIKYLNQTGVNAGVLQKGGDYVSTS